MQCVCACACECARVCVCVLNKLRQCEVVGGTAIADGVDTATFGKRDFAGQ